MEELDKIRHVSDGANFTWTDTAGRYGSQKGWGGGVQSETGETGKASWQRRLLGRDLKEVREGAMQMGFT